MMSRGLICFPPVFYILLAEHLRRSRRYFAMLAPWVELAVEQESRYVRQGCLRNGFGCMEQLWLGQHCAHRAHAHFFAELQQSLFSNDATPFIDLVGNVDLDWANLTARPA